MCIGISGLENTISSPAFTAICVKLIYEPVCKTLVTGSVLINRANVRCSRGAKLRTIVAPESLN